MPTPEGRWHPEGAGRPLAAGRVRRRVWPAKRSAEAEGGGVSGRCPRKRGETGTGSMRSTAERPRRGNALCGIRI
uniref:Uncharacterized protein n=1 Tax=Klebsiella pneumoniae TaxID=573 RepID=A0A482LYE8_KLEPN|nr:Hypothetical protein [Klebsiella pneumoniae]